ncbi:MAG: hypothetical protein Ta2A_10930 [Treponemataceae bacterium]|nr:MAG: hypothetical protein Ta2A_10930 [Treponemataceae bacterium]
MKAILKRELHAYFTSPIGYVYLAVFWFFAGYFLFTGVLINNSSVLTPVFQALLTVVMMLTPLLTMRLLSEERRHRTDQALLTSPVTLAAIVVGKFLAAAAVYTVGVSITLMFALVLNAFAPVNWALTLGNYCALLLLGLSFIAIGEFISSLTENQAIAAIASIAAMLSLFLLDALPSLINNARLAAVLRSISFVKRYTPITNGILSMSNLLFFVSAIALFLFLTVRVLEKRRGAVSVTVTTLVVAALVLANVVATALFAKYPLNIDLTANKVFAISQDTKDFLSKLDADVDVYVLNSETNFSASTPAEYFTQANEVIRQYAKLSPRVRVSYIDFTRNPDFGARYSDVKLKVNDILVVSGERYRALVAADLFNIRGNQYGSYVASSKAEQAMTRALLAVTSTRMDLVAVITGHDEEDVVAFTDLLKLNAYETVSLNLLTGDIPEEVTLIVLAAPARDLPAAELRKLDAYLAGGANRTFLYLAAASQPPLPNLAAFLAEWGIAVEEGIAFETDTTRIISNSAYIAILDYAESEYSKNAASRGLYPVIPNARPLRALFDASGYRTVTPLVRFSANSGIRPPDSGADWTPSRENRSPAVPALLLSRMMRSGAKSELLRSNVLVCGSSFALNQSILSSPNIANSTYFLDLLSALSAREANVRIEDKTLGFTELGATVNQVMVIALIFIALLPLTLLVTGVVVWLKRSRK